MNALKAFLILSLSIAARLPGQQAADPVCAAADKVSIPVADLPPAGGASLPCDPLELTSRPGHPVDLRATRYCAFLARQAKSTAEVDREMETIGGNAGLAMIYAGGRGVAPNLLLAERFACEIQGDWDNGTDVARMLEAKRQDGATRVDFDICENPSGRQLNYLCIVRNQARAADQVTLAEKVLNVGSAQQRAAFQSLLAARKAYLDAHAAEEPNGNTGLVQTALEGELESDETWARDLQQLSEGKLPHYGAADFRKADVELNGMYRKALESTAQCESDFCLKPNQLRKIERAWIAYREAWVAYAGLRWPSIPGDSWRTWLTLAQTADLKNL